DQGWRTVPAGDLIRADRAEFRVDSRRRIGGGGVRVLAPDREHQLDGDARSAARLVVAGPRSAWYLARVECHRDLARERHGCVLEGRALACRQGLSHDDRHAAY